MKDLIKNNTVFRICYVCRKQLELNSDNCYKNKTKEKGYELCCKKCSKQRLSQYKPKNKSEQEKKEYNKEHNTDYKISESRVQGSMAMHTVVQNDENDYDIDVAIVFESDNFK